LSSSSILKLDSLHSGFAARCEARLRLAVTENFRLGCALGSGSAPKVMGQRPNQGHSPNLSNNLYGGAEPRLTSGGEAATKRA